MFDLSPAFELLIFLSAIVWGARFGGLGLGMAGGTILCVLVLGGGTHPAPPPVDVMLIIMAVVTAAACLEGGGGGRYLIAVAERVLRRHPHRIALLAPASTYLATALCGTGYVSVALFRVISEVSIQAGIRPERPLSAALIAIQQAILVSPVSAATAALLAVLLPLGISWAEILLITLPATLLGSAAAVAAAAWRRSDLPPAPTMAAPPEAVAPIQPHERRALWAFVATVAVAIAVSACDTLRPQWSAGEQTVRLGVASALQIVMLGGSLFIAWAGRASSEAILETRVFRSGMMGAVSIFGIVWASDTLLLKHHAAVSVWATNLVQAYPYSFAIVLFLAAALLFSQSAAIRSLMPLGLMLGLPPATLVGMATACSGYFLIPTGALAIACASDRTGSTRIGRFLFDHSFLLPGLAATVVSVSAGSVFAWLRWA